MTIGEKLNASNDALSSLLTYANGVTGAEDTNIGDAIKTLCDGFVGGGVPGFSRIDSGCFMVDNEISISTKEFPISHNLGAIPRLIFVYAESTVDITAGRNQKYLGCFYFDPQTTPRYSIIYGARFVDGTIATLAWSEGGTQAYYAVGSLTETSFGLHAYTTVQHILPNVRYNWIALA